MIYVKCDKTFIDNKLTIYHFLMFVSGYLGNLEHFVQELI